MNNKEIRSKLYEIASIVNGLGDRENTTKYDYLYYHLTEALTELEGLMVDEGELNDETLTDFGIDDDAFISIYDDDNDGSFWGV